MPDETNIFERAKEEVTQSEKAQIATEPVKPSSPVAPFPAELDQEEGNPLKTVGKIVGGVIVFLVVTFLLITLLKGLFANKNQKVTLTYWGLWEDAPTMQTIISDFEKENPNITVNYTKKDVKQYRDELLTRVNNGSGPDIFRFHNTWVPELSGILLPLPNDVITKDDFKKTFYPVAFSDLSKNGGIYGIPLEIDDLVLFTNTDMFTAATLQPPTTWDEFGKDARQLTVPDSTGKIQTAGAAMGTYDNITHAPDILSLLFLQNGADLRNFDQSSQKIIDALNFYTLFATGNSNVWDATLDPSILSFAKGKLAMYFGFSWDILTIKQINPNLNFTISQVPHLPDKQMTVASYWVEGASNKSKHQREDYLFLNFLARKETEQKLFTAVSKTRLLGEPYARVDLADSLKGNALAYPFVSQGKTAASSYFASDTQDDGLNSQVNAYLGNAVRSILNGGSAESAEQTLSQGVSQVLSKYNF